MAQNATQTHLPPPLGVVVAARPKSNRKPLFIAIALVAVAGLAFLYLRAKHSSAVGQTFYRVTTAQVGSVRRIVSATGTLQPWTTVDIKSKAGGRVNEMAVDVGSVVKSGQILAKIDPSDSLLTYNQALADTESAAAKEGQSKTSYSLQAKQSQTDISQAQAAVSVAKDNLVAATARLQTARDQYAAQPSQTTAAIAQAQASVDAAEQDRAQLVETQTQERASTQAAYDQAVANDVNAQILLTRNKSLFQKGYIAASEVDQAQANAAVTAASVLTARAKLNTLAGQQKAALQAQDAKVRQAREQLTSAKSQVDVATRRNAVNEALAAQQLASAQLDQARAGLLQAQADVANNQLKSLDIKSAHATKVRADAALANAKTTLDQTIVRAPSDGVILHKYVEQGTIITSGLSLNSTGTSILQLGDVSKMYVYVLVDETDSGSISVGQRVNVSFDAFPNISFKGRVSRIDPQAQVVQNVTSIGVRVEIDNSQENFKLLKPALNATCDFIVAEKRHVISVPSEAVQTDANGPFVQVVTSPVPTMEAGQGGKRSQATLQNVKLQRRPVEIGFRGDDSVEITSGLRKGEVLVVQKVSIGTATNSNTQARGAIGGMGRGGMPGGKAGGR